MTKILVGGISPESEQLLNKYLNTFMPDAVIEPLKAVGIKGRIKNHAKRPDVALVVLDESLYQACVGVADDVLALPKVHKYINDDGFKQFLISKFGKLDDSSYESVDTNTRGIGLMTSIVEDDTVNLAVVPDVGETNDLDYESIINNLKDELSQSQLMVRNLSLQLDDAKADSDLSAFVKRIKELEGELESKNNELNKLKEDSFVELGKVARAEKIMSEMDSLKEELKGAREINSSLEYEKNKLSSEVELLDKQIEELKIKVADIGNIKQELSNNRIELQQKEEQIQGYVSKVATLEQELKTIKDDGSKSDEIINDLKNQISSLTDNITSLNDAINDRDTRLSDLSNLISELKSSIEEKDTEISSLVSQAAKKDEDLLEYTSKLDAINVNFDNLSNEVSEKDNELNTIRGTLDSVNCELAESKEELQKKETELESLRGTLVSKDTAISDLQNKLNDSSIRINELEEVINKSESDSQSIEDLKLELSNERNKSVILASEIEVLKRSNTDTKSEEYRSEIARLRSELEDLKSSSDNASEIDRYKKEIQDLRGKCSSLELDLVDKDEQLSELNKGVFAQMANIALPKVAFDFNLDAPTNDDLDDCKFVCVASGSTESTASVYQTLRKACVFKPDTRFLIVDLVTDSCIDREFVVPRVVSPINWLNGADTFKNYIADTKFTNVKVLSTALAYLNDLFLLQVNWRERIKELKGYADVVILNIGCLNNVVTKVLFSMLSDCMTTYVITKATPVNLRTVILNLTGFKALSEKVTVECVNFDVGSSNMMYQRLSQKYNAHILKDSEVLKF